MAWYDVTYKCGHTCRKQLYGTYKSRENYIEWAKESRLCPECEDKLRADNIRKENETAAQLAADNGYIELQGSPKQVAWANSIRARLVMCIDDYQRKFEAFIKKYNIPVDANDKYLSILSEIKTNILAIKSAKSFIDHWKYASSEDIRRIVEVKSAIMDNIIISDEDFKTKVLEYEIALIEQREAINLSRFYLKKSEVDAIKRMFPEQFT